ncbi:UDP:flavonoid glycosyltransferase YjiC (YdhE family) [Algoriphagus ratkowskyi]|uniref:Glycosyltransferase family 1 protein n=1 Tax=Algoriphagus ratkowskyi TaxID=57028 RepID=A0A2W7R077_9BACT|nr:glycosyltransferase [Algoriphagus ratkowskyi]PZX53924.1 UDP:flavonoid glycosyltransferase YjiC (YdhE family) [Algoriphagus ratkowskyi]TXD76676.1 glycosyltransferase family 1 protein [Algoriphagus ratkowskyi]
MKTLFASLGSRGDIEPFLAQAEIFAEAGHEVICLFPEQFRETVTQLGYEFIGFDKGFLELLDTQSGKTIMGGGGNAWNQLKNYFKLAKDSLNIQHTLITQQRDALRTHKPDRIVFHAKCLFYHLAAMADPDRFTFLTPIPCMTHPTSEFPHIGFGKWKFSSTWNLHSYGLINGIRRLAMKKFLGKFYADFPSTKINLKSIKEFEQNRLQTIYAISPSLFPRPDNWPESAKIVGYYFRNQLKEYQPSAALVSWLTKYPKAILITFGSMSNTKPKEHSKTIIDLLQKHQIPTIVNFSWGGLEQSDNSDESIFYINQIPYDWILPKLYGIIHHGGSGTTHQGTTHGCVQMIVPHIIDQYFWNRIIAERQLGPLGTSIHGLDAEKFEIALIDFWRNPVYAKNALKLSETIQTEVIRTAVLNHVIKK